jgi:hypothetical protein
MLSIHSNKAKMLACVAAMVVYAVLFAKLVKPALLQGTDGMPTVQYLVFFAAWLPILVLGSYAITFLLRHQNERKHDT